MEPRACLQQGQHHFGSVQEVLEVIEHQQRPVFSQDARHLLGRVALPCQGKTQGFGHCRYDLGTGRECFQPHEADALRSVLGCQMRGFQGQSGLADSARPRQRQQPTLRTGQVLGNLRDLLVPADARPRSHWQVWEANGSRCRAGIRRLVLIRTALLAPLDTLAQNG